MSLQQCVAGKSRSAAQTLFLGASIADFNVNMGWGGRPSQLTVKLIEDRSAVCMDASINPFTTVQYADGHYDTCASDPECFIDETGAAYNSNTSKEKIVPGKVYYVWTTAGFVSRYWYGPDPGFFGNKTCFTNTGAYSPANYSTSKGFDIINTPVMFRVGSFSFTGLVQSWERNYDSGGLTYDLTIESVDSALDQCHIILDKYAGSIFGKLSANAYGGPSNWTGAGLTYKGTIKQGNIPNVFNVYGFLESMGVYNFGGAQKNNNGISASSIVDALCVLTSSVSSTSDPAFPLDLLNKRAFSPFGRILLKVPQENETYLRVTPNFTNTYGFGLLPITYDAMNIERCHFTLDLSELPKTPLDFKISSFEISIMQLIQEITTATGVDFYFDIIPATIGSVPYNVMKIRTIFRSAQPDPRQIEKTIKSFEDGGYNISSSRLGKEKNTNVARAMFVGANQQRLYQAKSYRLAFSQSDYIYDSITNTFVEYFGNVAGTAGGGQPGKTRMPSGLSTRNTAFTSVINNAKYAALFNMDQDIHVSINGQTFATVDTVWSDAGLSASATAGNYSQTVSITKDLTEAATSGRFFPLYKDIICPFFGYKMEESVSIDHTNAARNVFRRIRPVWMDSWTGQILVLMDLSELPKTLSVNLNASIPGTSTFIISESELRCSGNFDSYITYCLGKTIKPDLYHMLFKAYVDNGKFPVGNEINEQMSQIPGNAAGAAGQSAPITPAPNQGNAINLNLFINPDFLKDLHELYKLIGSVAQYYGKKYLVKMPSVSSYKDQQYVDVQVPGQTNAMYAYQGTGDIFYSYEPASSDGAWEEFGNMIDDNIVVGGPDWYSLIDDAGKIKPILGFNASDSFDHLNHALCSLDTNTLASLGYGFDNYNFLNVLEIAKSGNCDDPYNFTYPSINIGGLSDNQYILKTSVVEHPNAFGQVNNIAQSCRRLYHIANVDNDFAFMDPDNLRDPRAIISIGADIKLRTASKLYSTDPNRTVVATASMEDLCIYLRSDTRHSINDDFASLMLFRIAKLRGNTELLNFSESNANSNYATISEKVAHPYFAAIPVKSNQYCYGPWTNYPDIDKAMIFPDAASVNLDNAIENLICGVKVEQKEEFAPWNFGGMAFLDRAALNQIYTDIQYQQVMETATISIPGLPIFGLGSSFSFYTSIVNGISYNGQFYTVNQIALPFTSKSVTPSILDKIPRVGTMVYSAVNAQPTITTTNLTYNIIQLASQSVGISVAPIITSIQCNISPQNVGTSYSFKTYIQKLGFFNKESTDRLKMTGQSSIKTNKAFTDIRVAFNQKINKEKLLLADDMTDKHFEATKFQSGFYGTSPGNFLIGSAGPFAYPPINIKQIVAQMVSGQPTDAPTSILRIGEDPGESGVQSQFIANPVAGLMKDVRWRTYVGAFTEREALPEINNNYNQKSVMSLDGIFSPVSFYPSKSSATYNLLKYFRKECSECKGTGLLKIDVFNYATRQKEANKEYPCPHCTIKKDVIGSSSTTTSSSSESLPPYIITNSNDFNTILEFSKSSSIGGSTSSSSDTSKQVGLDIPINLISLHPIVVPYGEFRNFNVQNSGTSVDKCRHCIEVVGRGNTPPLGTQGVNINNNLKTFYDKNTGAIIPQNINNTGVNADFYPYDILANKDRVNKDNFRHVMNQRFFGMRGPMIMHGWGYDTQGYPIPNASDEPSIEDAYGRAAKFLAKIEYDATTTQFSKLKAGDTFVLTQPTEQKDLVYFTKRPGMQILNYINEWIFPEDTLLITKVKVSNDLDGTPAVPGAEAFKNLGDTITKQYKHNGSKWVKQERSRKFYLNWAERPDLWPVGPIDLRWDESRKVWTVNSSTSPYKLVYITLEEDLVKEMDFDETYPARGFLDDIEYSKEPLPQGYRRLVYVKDKTGYTAPRGIKLLCRYDTDTGFYEPISKPSVVAQGTLDVGNKARIDMEYAQGSRAGVFPVLLADFQNPLSLGFIQGQKAMFTYLRGHWILTAIKQ